MTTYDHRWQARPVLAAVLRCVLLAVPLLASSATVFAASRALPADTTRTWWGLGLLLVVGPLSLSSSSGAHDGCCPSHCCSSSR